MDGTIPKDPRECYHCCKTLTVKDKSTWFHMEMEDIKRGSMTFTSLYAASKVTGISDCALTNACEKTNKKITRRKGEFARYKIDWFNIYRECNPSPRETSKGVVESYVIPRWDINEMYP